MFLLLYSLWACAPEAAPVPPDQAAQQVLTALDEAAYLHGNGHRADAIDTWTSAQATFADHVVPALRDAQGRREAVCAELLMGQVRVELGTPRGHPEVPLDGLALHLEEVWPAPEQVATCLPAD